MSKEAMFYIEEDNIIKCRLCPHRCNIKEDQRGICNVREAKKDKDDKLKLYSINYGKITSISLDPIEKKPLYNFCPGTNILSIGSFGCNFKCTFCQNYSISQFEAENRYVPVEEIANLSIGIENSIGLAFTYNEPTIWYEYVYDVAKEIKRIEPNHKIVLVTNGYILEEPLKELLQYVDALNIDLKGGEEYYKKLCFGSLSDVKNTIKVAWNMGKHIEVTTLLVPGENTDVETINSIGEFLSSIDKNIPIHISRYFPRYKMDKPATELEMMKEAYTILKSNLNIVYLGNLTKEEVLYCLK